MINKIVFSIILFIIILSLSQIFMLGSNIIGINEYAINLSKNIIFNIIPFFYIYGCSSPILYSGIYKKTNKVDIVICNHITNLDFGIVSSIIRKFDDRNIYVVYQKEVIYIPYLGSFSSKKDIGMHFNKADKNIDNIKTILSYIENGIILIMPEGNVSSTKLKIKSNNYCSTNNLHIFKNTLYPKIKGLWTIYITLTEMNKMGNIIDMSIVIENFYKKQITILDLLTKDFGNTFVKIVTLEKTNLNNYIDFKKWFISKWIIKDEILETMLINKYNILYPVKNTKYYAFLIYIIILFVTMSNTFLIIISTIISSSLILYRNTPDINTLFKFIYNLLYER